MGTSFTASYEFMNPPKTSKTRAFPLPSLESCVASAVYEFSPFFGGGYGLVSTVGFVLQLFALFLPVFLRLVFHGSYYSRAAFISLGSPQTSTMAG